MVEYDLDARLLAYADYLSHPEICATKNYQKNIPRRDAELG